MDLKELTDKTLKIFNIDNTADLPPKLMECVEQEDIETYDKFENLVGDLSTDWMQFQSTLLIRGATVNIGHK